MQRITPFLWFDHDAEEAARFYVSIFRQSRIGAVLRYGAEGAAQSGRTEGSVMTVDFQLDGQRFVALNGGPHFRINEAVSFVIDCDTQEEIDYYWERLGAGADPAARRCGWLKDRFGVSWQVVPKALGEMLGGADRRRSGNVMQAVLGMQKIDIAALRAAYARD